MKKIMLFVACLFVMGLSFGQTVITMNGTQSQSGCAFTIYDHGGLHGDYAGNRSDMLTIQSTNTAAACVQISVVMADFDVHPSDTLFIYDGMSDNDPLLGKLNNDMVANVSANEIIYTATVYNTSGAITVKFVSDNDDHGGGYVITTECVAPCQRVQVAIDSTLSSHIPFMDSDGFYYINVCPYDTVRIAAYGIYPDNNFSYNQSDATSTFSYDISGFNTIDTLGGNSIIYDFPEGRGYDVAIMITDSAGCASTMPAIFRVRTSSNPIRALNPMPEICVGQTLEFTLGYDLLSAIQVDTIGSEQATSMTVCDTIFLPDGIDCGSGCAYQSPVTFTAFAPSATIQNASDILFVRAKLEHSFIGDIFIGLTCPNGQMAKLVKKYGSSGSANCAGTIPQPWGWNVTTGVSSGAYLGDPVDDSGGGCTPTPMGNPWNYCWSNNTTQGYQYAAGQGYVYESVNIHNNHIDSTNVANMTQVYHPDDPFTSLIGCPMNGTWALTVIDGWSADNGYVTEWELALDPALLPQDWSYNVVVDTSYLIGPGSNGPFVVPEEAGTLDYIVRVVDEYGCIYDTTTVINVTPTPIPELGENFNICHGDMIQLAPDYNEPNTVYHWNTGDETKEIMVVSAGTYTVDIATTNAAGTLTCTGKDSVTIGIFEAPIFDYEPSTLEGCVPLTVRFRNNSTPEGSTYLWQLFREDGTLAYSSMLAEPSFIIDDPGIYHFYVKSTTADGCTDSVIIWNYITANSQPIAEFAANPEISLMAESDGLVQFINYGDSTFLNEPGSSFFWDFDDGARETQVFSPQHQYSQWGDYNVTLHMETSAGCSSEIVHTVVVEQDLVFPNVITPNGDGMNDFFAIQNLNTDVNPEDPDKYRNNKLIVYDRWGHKVYEAVNYDSFARDGQTPVKGTQYFDGHNLADGVYYYSFYYKGKAKTITYNGSITIVR